MFGFYTEFNFILTVEFEIIHIAQPDFRFLCILFCQSVFCARFDKIPGIKQRKVIYKWSNRILVIGFIFLTISLIIQYYKLGTIPALNLKSSISFFAWVIMGLYLILQLKFRLMVLGSFLTPLIAVLLIVSISIPGSDISIKPMLKNIWLPIHVATIFIGDGMFTITFIAAVMYLIQERHIKLKKRVFV